VRILLTGGSGYLGSATVAALRTRGHDVATIGRHEGIDTAVCDLANAEALRAAVRTVGDFDTVVHLAARAHGFRGLSLDDLMQANATITGNLIAALGAEGRESTLRFVHASSVAVYELLDAERGLAAEQAPYAASKLKAEQLLQQEPFQSLSVLRFAPIYDPTHLQDVAKRVFLPGTQVKVRLCPPPRHSLCSLDRAAQAVVAAVERPLTKGTSIANVTDPQPISQSDLADWFSGPTLPLPTPMIVAIAVASEPFGRLGRRVSHLIRKFCTDTTYPDPERSSVKGTS